MWTHLWARFRTSLSRRPRDRRRQSPSGCLRVEPLDERCLPSADVVLQWNQAVLAAVRADKPTIGFVTRDLAIVHTAIYDAVNAIDRTSGVFRVQANAPADASPVAAADAAGLFTASALFPTDTAFFQATYQAALTDLPDGPGKTDGLAVGRSVAEQTLSSRATDGANAFVPYTPGTAPGDWRPTPHGFAPAQTPQWPAVTPFALDSGSQFRPGPPPALASAAYAAAFNEVKALGRADSTARTPQQTEVARFWEAKAGTPQIAGYWNEIAETAAASQANTLDQDARLFAELNVALADETIALFDAKYTYNRWRPVTAIQLADQDGNPGTAADPNWLPLLNTANHPSWVSAHGGISGAAASTLANFFGTDNVGVSLTSEDLKGVTRSFGSFSAAAAEAENSVVWSGNHFRFDVTAGDAQGRSVAQFVDRSFFKPLPSTVFRQANLVSDIPGLATHTDPLLQNPWGVSLSPDGLFRVDDNRTGLSTVYDADGRREPGTVEIPLPPGSTGTSPATPDGTVLNTTPGFVISEDGRSAPASSIFATEDGTIAAFNAQVDRRHALIEVDNSAAGAVYKALTLADTAQGTFIYATNFHDGTVDVFDSHFRQVHQAGSFADPTIPAGFAPFGIKDVNGTIFVAYAKQLAPGNHADQAGPGNGFIDEFDTSGNLIGRFASQGPLNSPHGMVVAPADFGAFGNVLLVGNFGDGRINAFDLKTGRFLGQLSDAAGRPIANPGIWGMTFGNGAGGTRTDTLYFAAGINGENDGLFASISLANPGDRDGDGGRDRGHPSHEGQDSGPVATRGDRDRRHASRSPDAARLDSAAAGQSAVQPADTGQVRGVAPGDRAAASSTSTTARPERDPVSVSASEHLGPNPTGNVAARRPGGTLDQTDPFTDADLGSL
jgi:uncharacterized protein (TIGR03118 family)